VFQCHGCGSGSEVSHVGSIEERRKEVTNVRYDIANFSHPFAWNGIESINRFKWYDHKLTEEEEEAMELEVAPKDESSGAISETFLESVNALPWDVSTKAAIKKTSASLVELIIAEDSPIATPEGMDLKKIKMAVGTFIVGNKEKSAQDILQLVVEKYGLKEAKAKASKDKSEGVASLCAVPENGKVFEVIMEFADAYSQEANYNAAGTYRKVAQVIKDLDFEITVENAKGLGGGKKTKVAGES